MNEQCEGRPYSMTMLLTGGDCSQSLTPQLGQPGFSCFDIAANGVAASDGTVVFVVVSSVKDPSVVYTQQYVSVGSTFQVDDSSQIALSDQKITIYSSDQLEPSTQLQTITYQSSCSQNLFLKDRFGAVQVVGWVNDGQGVVSSYANVTFDVSASIVDTSVSDLLVTSFTAETSFGTFDFTDEFSGQSLAWGSSILASFDATIDLTSYRRYNVLSEVTGQNSNGQVFSGAASYEFATGPVTSAIPSLAPVIGGSMPLTACSLSASIECSLTNDPSRTCKTLVPPAISKCSGGKVKQLQFLYNAQSCTASNTTATDFECSDVNGGPISSQVYITITDEAGQSSYFTGIVEPGIIFATTSDAELTDKIKVDIASLENGEPGDLLQTFLLSSSCAGEENDVSLLTQYGSLQLTAFESPESGFQAAIEVISQVFVVTNDGDDAVSLSWANITSTLFGTTSLISPPGLLLSSGESITFPFETTPLNLYASAGRPISSTFDVSGIEINGEQSTCSDSDELIIVVG